MVNTELFAALIAKVTPTVRLIMIGDPDQLPSIGVGDILRDLIETRCVPTVTLKICFRQSQTSGIVRFATRVIGQSDPGMAVSILGDSLMDDISFCCIDETNDGLILNISDIVARPCLKNKSCTNGYDLVNY